MPKAVQNKKAKGQQESLTLAIARSRPGRAAQASNASANAQQSTTANSMEELPGELLNKIYEDIGFSDERLNLLWLRRPALTTAIPDLAETYHAMFFDKTKFHVNVYNGFVTHARMSARGSTAARRVELYGLGRLAIPPAGWLRRCSRENPDSIRFRDICMHICQKAGQPLADVFIKCRRFNGKKTKLFVATRKNRHSELTRMIETARGVTKTENAKAEFAGLSLQQLELIAGCFA